MAEARRFADLRYGQLGKITYLPRRDDNDDGPGLRHTSRLVSHAPQLRQISSAVELYPGSKPKEPESTHTHLWAERNLQRRWLLKSHPEANMSNPVLSTWLNEDMSHFENLADSPSPQNLLAFGEIPDSRPRGSATIPVLASVTGASGELLRIARLEDSKWAWEGDKDSALHIPITDPQEIDDEVVWASDGLPISRVKFFMSANALEPIRWFIVQKDTSTTILSPRYNRAPVAENQSYLKPERTLSRIQPKPLLTLGHHETGGNAHCDVAFNAADGDNPPQLCVMDECGYWTLWSIGGFSRSDKRNLRLSLLLCGHIWQGSLQFIPTKSDYRAEHHGVCFVGASPKARKHDVDISLTEGLSGETVARSRRLVQWNSTQLKILDTELRTFVPEIVNFAVSSSKFGRISDVSVDPTNPDQIFVLTTRSVLWIAAPQFLEASEMQPRPRILLACAHGAVSDAKIKMRVGVSGRNNASPMLSLYSPGVSRITTFWFSLDSDTGLPQWSSQSVILSLQSKEAHPADTFREVMLQPSKLTCTSSGLGLVSQYLQAGVQFYQAMLLGSDLSVHYAMCFSCTDEGLNIKMPVERIGWSKADQRRRWRKRRLKMLRHVGFSVVVPDHLTAEAMMVSSRPRPLFNEELDPLSEEITPRKPAPVKLNFEYLRGAIEDHLALNSNQTGQTLSAAFLDTMKGLLQERHEVGSLPLMTWKDVASFVEVEESADVWSPQVIDDKVESFLGQIDQHSMVTRVVRDLKTEMSASVLSFSALYKRLLYTWVEPLEGLVAEETLHTLKTWAKHLAHDVYLSSHGVLVQDVPLFSTSIPDTQQASQQVSSSMPFPSSQASNSTLPSSPPTSSTATSPPDGAFQRLALLAPSIKPGKIGNTRQAEVLSYWPAERGVDMDDYVSSVTRAADKKLDAARERLQKIESRRKALSERYKRPPTSSLRQGIPDSSQTEKRERPALRPSAPTHFMSSQQAPSSSQTQVPPAITMSQVVPGAFGGDRKKPKKAKKKKSGFR